jgi:hypothetical protein
MHRPACIIWADLTPFSLQLRLQLADALERSPRAVPRALEALEAREALEFESAPAPAPPNGPALPAEQLELMQAYAAGRNVYGVQGFT